jgi:hypothetical protein
MEGEFRAVEPMNENQIERDVSLFKQILGVEGAARVSLIRLLEMLDEWIDGYVFTVLPDDKMPGLDGYTGLDHYEICLSETTYCALREGDSAARHTAAHEIGHLMLHSKMPTAYARRSSYQRHVDPEWQADHYADVFLMPAEGVKECQSAEEVAERFSVPLARAEIRFEEVTKIQGELFA